MQKVFCETSTQQTSVCFFQSFDIKPAIKDFYYELDDRKLWGLGALSGKRQAGEVEKI